MKLDRNINPDGRGKYALLKLRVIGDNPSPQVLASLSLLEKLGILDWGNTIDSEFFVIRLKDKYADDALSRDALSAQMDGEGDYAREIEEMASRAGVSHPNCRKPD